MIITQNDKATDPPYPIMHGETPLAKEFNKRQQKLWTTGVTKEVNYEQISTVLLEIFADEYNKRHSPRGKKTA